MAIIYGSGSTYLKKRRRTLGYTVLGVFILLEATILSLRLLRPLPSNLALIGLIVILLLIGYVLDTFKFVENKYFNYFDGIFGEERVVKVLRQLPDEYTVFRNLQIRPKCDIDVVVIGPTGVYSLEVKSHIGRIGFDGQHLTHNGKPFPEKNVLQQTMGEAMDVHDYLAGNVNKDVFITPFIVFSSTHVGLRLGKEKIKGRLCD